MEFERLQTKMTKFSWRSWLHHPIANTKFNLKKFWWKKVFKNHNHKFFYALASFGSVGHDWHEADVLMIDRVCKRCKLKKSVAVISHVGDNEWIMTKDV